MGGEIRAVERLWEAQRRGNKRLQYVGEGGEERMDDIGGEESVDGGRLTQGRKRRRKCGGVEDSPSKRSGRMNNTPAKVETSLVQKTEPQGSPRSPRSFTEVFWSSRPPSWNKDDQVQEGRSPEVYKGDPGPSMEAAEVAGRLGGQIESQHNPENYPEGTARTPVKTKVERMERKMEEDRMRERKGDRLRKRNVSIGSPGIKKIKERD